MPPKKAKKTKKQLEEEKSKTPHFYHSQMNDANFWQ